MKLLAIASLVAAVALAPSVQAQNTQDLPAAPSTVKAAPRFPGAPAQQPANSTAPSATQQAPAPQQSAAPNSGPTADIPDEGEATPAASAPAAQEAAPKPNDQGTSAPPNTSEPSAKNPAQASNDSGADEPITTIRTTVNEVNLIFTVTDKHGHFVKNLNQNDIRLLDEGKPPVQISTFGSETGLPLRVGLLIDASNSIRERFHFEQEAAVEFLHQIVRPRSDQAFVIGFDSTAEITQDYTDNIEMLGKGIRVLRPGGGTAMYDAVYDSAEKLAKSRATGPVRRAIIVLSDGEDNQSRHTREEAVEMAQRAEVIVYCISTNISNMKSKGDKVLERFAEATGGRTFFPFKIEDVANAFSEIQDELRSQYVIAYKPQNFVADGRFRSIAIDAPNNKNLRVRARKGYYAPKQ